MGSRWELAVLPKATATPAQAVGEALLTTASIQNTALVVSNLSQQYRDTSSDHAATHVQILSVRNPSWYHRTTPSRDGLNLGFFLVPRPIVRTPILVLIVDPLVVGEISRSLLITGMSSFRSGTLSES